MQRDNVVLVTGREDVERMVGGELFHGCPITVNVEEQGDGNGSNPALHEGQGHKTLDLRGCINGASELPPLCPARQEQALFCRRRYGDWKIDAPLQHDLTGYRKW